MSIELKNVSKSYQKKLIFEDVNLQINRGTFVMLRGLSGAGKTTLLNIIGGIDRPSSGEILIDEQNVAKLHGKVRTEFFRKKVGFIFQGFYLQPQLTVAENIELAGVFANIPPSKRHERVEELAKQLGITEVINSLPAGISGGQAERVCVAQALFMEPEVILADEPTNNLDSQSIQKVLEVLRDVQQIGVTVIIASHDERIERYAEQIVNVADGKVWVA